MWFRSLSRYVKTRNFDSVTQVISVIKIDEDEEGMIKNIVIHSMAGDMENYEFDEKLCIETILFIKQLLGGEFPRSVKDRMWR